MEEAKEIKKDLPLAHELVAGVLREGKDNSLTSKEIIKLLGWNGNERRSLFHIIQELINEYDYIIGTSRSGVHRGYYLITNSDELVDTLRPYNAQIMAMLKRYKKLNENYAKRDQESFDI